MTVRNLEIKMYIMWLLNQSEVHYKEMKHKHTSEGLYIWEN